MSGARAARGRARLRGLVTRRREDTRAGVLAGIGTGRAVLYVTRVLVHQPLGIHEAVWSLALNFAVTIIVSRLTQPPSESTRTRIHGEIERFVYGGQATG